MNYDEMFKRSIHHKISAERQRQDNIHPIFPEDNGLRLSILVEEVGEVAKALNEGKIDHMRTELVEVAAVAIRWLEHLGPEPESDSKKRIGD